MSLMAKCGTFPQRERRTGEPMMCSSPSQVVELVGSLPRISERLFIHTTAGSMSRYKLALDAECGVEVGPFTTCDGQCAAEWRGSACRSMLSRSASTMSRVRSGVAGIYNRYSYEAEKREAMEKWARHVVELTKS